MYNPVQLWRRQKKDQSLLGKEGVVLSWTVIAVAPSHMQHETPYTVALVQFSDGSRICAQVTSASEKQITIGSKVRTTLRKIGQSAQEDVIGYGVKLECVI